VERYFQKAEADLLESFTKQFKPTRGLTSGCKLPENSGRRCHKVSAESCLAKGHVLW